MYEIVVPARFGDIGGFGKPNPVLPEIYRWNAKNYQESSAQYPWYYRQVVLPSLEQELQKLETLPQPNTRFEQSELRLRREELFQEIAEARKRAGLTAAHN